MGRASRLLAGLFAAGLLTAPAEAAGAHGPCPSLVELRRRLAAAEWDAGRRREVDAFAACAARVGTPVVEPSSRPGLGRALFVFRGAASKVTLAGDVNGWDPESDPLERLSGTDLWVRLVDLPDDARLDYKLVVDGGWRLDPWNPRTCTGGFGPNSELRMPRYAEPEALAPRSDVARGRLEELPVESRALGGSRTVTVWVPPGGGPAAAPLPSLYLLDGGDYLEFAGVVAVAERLVAERKVPRLLLVLVPPVDRRLEYGGNPDFERFVVSELVPLVDARYPTRREAVARGVMGVSLGGLAALSLTARHPGTFGRCGAQSTGGGSEAGREALFADLARLSPSASAFHLDVGTFEKRLHGTDLLALSRRVRDALLSRGARVQYREVPEGHSWGSWRARIPEALSFLFGAAAARGSAPLVLPGPPEGAERRSGAPVSLDVKDADLAEVVRGLVVGRGLSLVLPAGLRGTVTATLRDVPWEQALDLVLSGNGYAFVRDGTVVRVLSREELLRESAPPR